MTIAPPVTLGLVERQYEAPIPATRQSSVCLVANHLRSEGGVIAMILLPAYLTVAVLLDFVFLIFDGDATARAANGSYVLFSRDPHLAAIGFVWNPLQSICDLVFLLFRDLWPPLATHGVAASLVSVICMTGAVLQVRSALAEWGVPRSPRLVLVALFALNPMIVFYAGNGMSEALYLLTLVATARYLARWIVQDDLRSLVYAGIALGLCYLARNEAAAAAAGVGIVVVWVAATRSSGRTRERLRNALTDATVVLLPFGACFIGWAVASYVITGQPFAQFTSQYGTASQLVAIGATKPTLGAGLNYEMRAMAYLAPLLPLILAVSLVRARSRRDQRVLAPALVFGGALGFDLLAYLAGRIDWSIRYYIVAIPMYALLVGMVLSPPVSAHQPNTARSLRIYRTQPAPRSAETRARQKLTAGAAIAIALFTCLPSLPATATGMMDKTIGWDQLQLIGFVFRSHLPPVDEAMKTHYQSVLRISRYIENLRLPDGDIILDNFSYCAPDVIMTIRDPKVFVIPNDRDFQRQLADPLTFHSHYILTPQPLLENTLAVTNRTYPTLWASGAGFTTLAHEFKPGGLCPDFRLYRVLGHPSNN